MKRPLVRTTPDLYTEVCNGVVFFTPVPGGQLTGLARASSDGYLTGWAFSDGRPEQSSYLCGSIEQSEQFAKLCLDLELVVAELGNLSVPFAAVIRHGERAGQFPLADFAQCRRDVPSRAGLIELIGHQ